NAVTFLATGGANEADFSVSPSGAVSVVGGPLAAGGYTVTGTDSDSSLVDSGIWSYTLTVNGVNIAQTAPASAATTTSGSTTFSDQLEPTTAPTTNSPVSYLITGGANEADFSVTSAGLLSVVGGPLAVGPYTVTGMTSDLLDDAGTWTFTLTVGAGTITQTAPTSGNTTVANSTLFSAQLEPTTNSGHAVSYLATGGANEADFAVTSAGVLSVVNGPLGVGDYTVTGTDSDTLSNAGTWTFTLDVVTSGGSPPGGVTLKQSAPTSGTTTTTASSTFTAGPLSVSNATGAVTFTTTATSPALSVSPSGAITTTGPLTVGSYLVSGTDSDTSGDTGTWSYTLNVTLPDVVVTFEANGGTGSMTPESNNGPSALTPNTFTWAKHAFTKWTTAANGSGSSYANGATYPFSAATTLYAQWVATTHPAIKHTVTFNANGGRGVTAAQTNSVLATLTTNGFTRSGYTFKGWNTSANGSGTSYDNRAAYSFKRSTTLYAQWSVRSYKVTFDANGGSGSMTPESKKTAGRLSSNGFTRSGYTFRKWTTAANGSGDSYANNAVYRFTKSVTLYAQWTPKKVVVVVPVHAVVTLAPFTNKSDALSPALESQITALAALVKVDHDTKVALVGFSGDLTTANESNEEAWSASLTLAINRAQAVKTYLAQQLDALGLSGYLITTSGSTKALVVASANQPQNRKVVASIS
ncbi:MAG: InlB B-repeat-containing protein, partial [Acidimicrobiales bacterium]